MPEHTIAENLTRLQTARTAIASAITAKGGTVAEGDGLEEFPKDIETIPSGSGTTDYSQLTNKPAINGVELIGNQTTSSLGIQELVPNVDGENLIFSIN